MVLNIITFPVDNLRKKSLPVQKIDEEIKTLIKDMADTLYDEMGYGLAAPQVGRHLRLILVDEFAGKQGRKTQVFINPEFTLQEGEMMGEEGCLSIPGEYAAVKRYSRVKVKALNEHGIEFEIEATEQMARILQHEIDHLDGVLFIDRLPSFKRDILKKHIKRRMQNGEYNICNEVSPLSGN